MSLESIQRIGSLRLAVILRWLGCFGVFRVVNGAILFFAFPIGGGAFHAMFAYSDSGRSSVALAYCGYQLASCLLANVLLQFFRAGVPWWALGLMGVLSTHLDWAGVVYWPDVSGEFREMAVVVAWCLPAVCFVFSFATRRVGLLSR